MAHIHIHLVPKRTADASSRFVTKVDIKLPSGKILPLGSVVYKQGSGYVPWNNKGMSPIAIEEKNLVDASATGDAKDSVEKETTDADEKIGLWQYTESTNSWRLIRSCTLETSKEWLATMKGREPKEIFVLSKTRPANKPTK